MNNENKIQIYLSDVDNEQIESIIEKNNYEGTPLFNSVSHFCRCGVKRFIKNGGNF